MTEYKTLEVGSGLVKSVDQGIVEHLIAVYGNVDYGNDVIHPGASAKTLMENGHKLRVLDSHNTGSVMNVIGKPITVREVGRAELPAEVLDRYPAATGGVMATTQYLMDTERGREVFARIKAGAVAEYSIGFRPITIDYSTEEIEGQKVTVRHLREIALLEYGPVVFGMNDATTTVGVKNAGGDSEPQVKVKKTEVDGEHPASHYLVVEDPEVVSTWHLRVRDVNGELDPRLMGAAWAALHGGYRGNVYEGPGKAEAIAKLKRLYEQIGRATPEERAKALIDRIRRDDFEGWIVTQAIAELGASAEEYAADFVKTLAILPSDELDTTSAGPEGSDPPPTDAPRAEELLGLIDMAEFELAMLDL